ncbi:MAG: aldehyde dehydrogenase family protein [Candidatus Limnocylindrales bacterium]
MVSSTDKRVVPVPTNGVNSWGLGDGQAIPWEYAPAPEARDLVTLKERYGLFINGRSMAAIGGATFTTVDPATELPLAKVARATTADVDKAVRAARRAQSRSWGQLPGKERAKYLFRISRILQERSREFAVLESMDLGQADQGEPRRRRAARGEPLLVLRGLGGQAGLRVPGSGSPAARRRRPDHPLELPAPDAGLEDRPGPRRRQHRRPQARLDDAALGAPVRGRLRPGGPAARHGQHRHRPGRDRDGPRHPQGRGQGRLHGIHGDRSQDRPGVAGTDKALTLELGGKAANIVFDDAPLDQAIEGIVNGIYFNQGEVCCAGSRLLVQESIAEPLIDKLKDRLATIRVGDPLDKNTDVGAINSKSQLDKITELVQSGIDEGADIYQPACDLPDRGYFFRPTLFTNVAQSHRIAREEIFGPVLSVLTFRTPEEAIEKANNTVYGLSAGVWTDKGSRILEMVSRLKAGVVWANTFNRFDPTSPFGGYKDSGFGREGGMHGLHAYVRLEDR